jgi:hypothetical protein
LIFSNDLILIILIAQTRNLNFFLKKFAIFILVAFLAGRKAFQFLNLAACKLTLFNTGLGQQIAFFANYNSIIPDLYQKELSLCCG